jgi:pimeloyl-ACP methyl ester carboxylesterase
MRSWLACVLAVLFVLGCNGGGSESQWEACPHYVDNPTDLQAECATFLLPLKWSQPDGSTIDVFVQRLSGTDPGKRRQFWLLAGGPGFSGANYDRFMETLSGLDPGLDLYLLDRRGVGRSARLGCTDQESEQSEEGYTITENEWPGCIQSLKDQWGDDLAEFNTTAAARDLNHLIELTREPGQDVFIYGSSCGTVWAHRYLQLFPDQPTGVILDSLAIHMSFSEYDAFFDQVGEAYIQYCADDALCSGKLGNDPWSTIGALFDKLDQGHCPDLEVTTEGFRNSLGTLLMYWSTRTLIPPLVYRLDRCSPSDVTAIEHIREVFAPSGPPSYYETLASSALFYHVVLSEMWADPPPSPEDLQTIVDGTYMTNELGPPAARLYDLWPRYSPDEFQGEWADTQVPMLMMSGELDPQTPIWVANPAAGVFNGPHQHFYTFPRTPHNVVNQSYVNTPDVPNCGTQLLLAFLADPTTEPDAACLDDIRAIDFAGTPKYSDYFFGTEDLWEDNP